MSDSSRKHILDNLRRATDFPAARPAVEPIQPRRFSPDQKIERLQRLMEAMRTEIHISTAGRWISDLIQIVREKNLRSLLYAPGTDIGKMIEEAWQPDQDNLPDLRPYQQDIEAFKEELFDIDAGITGTMGAIAETGALILWPTPEEPRLMSLVPPVHIAVLSAEKIHDTFFKS